jgi:hypothetical protein
MQGLACWLACSIHHTDNLNKATMDDMNTTDQTGMVITDRTDYI